MFPFAGALVDLVLPSGCAGCGRPARGLCAGCRPGGPPVRLGGAPVPIVAAAAYEDVVRRAVLAYKERGRRDLAPVLGELLGVAAAGVLGVARPPPAAAAAARPPGPQGSASTVVLVPVPSSRAARTARDGDHLRPLARRAARCCRVRVARDVLVLARSPVDSAGLGIAARAANLDGAMRAVAAPPDLAALVVDDVVTTGATAREALRALRAAGWPVVGVAAVAATPRRHGRGALVPLAAPR